jgi:hypothetical protein
VSTDDSPERHMEFDCFDAEVDEFPYPDGSFDVVVFSELIEHLSLNPVWALSEIHRVLRPGGHVIITTPNAISLERLSYLLRGVSHDDDRYVPHLGPGARHNREYNSRELEELLYGTGFMLETLSVRDLVRWSLPRRLWRGVQKRILRLWSDLPRTTHIFLRARREETFRWYFPYSLYAHMQLYTLARHGWIQMGANDSIQCTQGWLPLENWEERGGLVRRASGSFLHDRWIDHVGAVLRAPARARRLVVRLTAAGDATDAAVVVRVLPHEREGEDLANLRVEVSRGTWVDAPIALARPLVPDEVVAVRIAPATRADDVAVSRLWLDDGAA